MKCSAKKSSGNSWRKKAINIEFIPAKSILARTKNRAWFGADYNINLYRGCCHGCIYCDSRSDCYQVGDFDRVRAKRDALAILERELRAKRNKGLVAMGAMSDPYNPFERTLGLTRDALELLAHYGFGVAVATKSDLITRDVDVLARIARRAPVLVKLTVTAARDELSAQVEPHAPPSSRRFRALRVLGEHGIFAGVLMMPVLPFLEDHEENILDIVRQAAVNGAKFIYPGMGVTMRSGQREYLLARLEALRPGLAQAYTRAFGSRYQCPARNAKQLYTAFSRACRAAGVLYKMDEINHASQSPYAQTQLSFF